MEWLDEVLSEGVIPDEFPSVEVPAASDVDEVNRLLRRRRAILVKQAKFDKMREAEVKAIEEWHVEETAKLVGAKAWIDRALDGWARAEFEQSGTKTHKLPHGTIRVRPGSDRVDALGGDTADKLAKGFAEFVRVKHEVDKKAVAALCVPGRKVSETAGTVTYEAVYKASRSSKGVVVPGVFFVKPVEGTVGLNVTVQQ